MASLISFLETIPEDTALLSETLYIQSSLKQLNIAVNWDHFTQEDQKNYDDTTKPIPKKKIIFTSKPNAKYDNPIVRECNGIVMELGSHKIIAYPPDNFVPFLAEEVKKNINHYYIFKANQGTIITLGYYPPTNFNELDPSTYGTTIDGWNISTRNGVDVGDLKWNKTNKTYKEILLEIIDRTIFDKLNKKYCYTLGFTYPDCHVFNVTNSQVWFIQSRCLDANEKSYLIPNFINNDLGLPNHEIVNVEKISNLITSATDALMQYINGGVINYGYILRSVNREKTGKYSDIYIESSLSSILKTLIYNTNLTLPFIIVDSYISLSKSNIFITLFPQYKKIYENLDNLFCKLTDLVLYKFIFDIFNTKDPIEINIVRTIINILQNNTIIQSTDFTTLIPNNNKVNPDFKKLIPEMYKIILEFIKYSNYNKLYELLIFDTEGNFLPSITN
jgi:hypothetical protein